MFAGTWPISLTPQTVSPDFAEIAATLKQRIKRRSLIVFLTSLDDPVVAEDFIHTAELLSRQHLILAVMIAPQAVQPLFSEGTVKNPDEIYAKLGGHLSLGETAKPAAGCWPGKGFSFTSWRIINWDSDWSAIIWI